MGDFVERNIKIIIAAGAAAVVGAVLLAFFLIQGKFLFRSEPVLNKTEITLEKKPLKSREKQNPEFCRQVLGSDAQKNAYDKLKTVAAYDGSEQFWVDGADKNDFQIALTAFLSDYPEVFWIDPASGYSYYEDDDSLAVELNFTAEGEELASEKAALDAAVEKAALAAPDNASDYEVELYLNDYLSENCEYDAQAENKHNAYGALTGGRSVCDGYSRPFQLLCQRLVIACTVVEGNSEFNDDTEDGHMWNCVRLGEDWYHVDVTWNDSTHAVCGVEHYFYLNLTTEEISRDHIISGDFSKRAENRGNFFNIFVPECNSDTLNYMKLNFAEIKDPEDDEQIIATLIAAAREKQTYCAYLVPDNADFNAVREDVVNNYAAIWIFTANRFAGVGIKISENTKVASYEDKRVLALQLHYQ